MLTNKNSKKEKKTKEQLKALLSTSFLKSMFSLMSEFRPQIHALFFQGFELKTDLCDLTILMTAGPGV